MTCTDTVAVVVLKALCFEGKPHAAGARLQLTPLKAGSLLMSPRAALADEADRATVHAALQRADADFIARDRTSYRGSLYGSGAAGA